MKRLATAAIAIPLALLLTQYSPDWLFAIVAGVLAAMMLDEFLNMSAATGIGRPGRWFLVPGGLVAASFLYYPGGVVFSAAAAALCLTTSSVFGQDLQKAFGRVSAGLGGMVYCAVLPGFLLLLPRPAIFVLFAVIWAGDSAAYYGGRALGKHLLAPRVSPKKTVEGSVAGLIGSIVAGTAMGVWLLPMPWPALAGICAVTAVAGQVGDLAESALKRSSGVKDSSSILPGHGGILDRLDSLLFAAPVFFWLFNA